MTMKKFLIVLQQTSDSHLSHKLQVNNNPAIQELVIVLGIDILDDALKDLGTKKLPLQVKIKEWLEKGEHKITDNTTEMKTYCTHLKNMLNTLIQRQQESNIIDDNASIPGPPSQHVHSTMLKEHSHCREDVNEVSTICSILQLYKCHCRMAVCLQLPVLSYKAG